MIRDPYTVFGVSRDASPEDIKRAYRRLAKQYHPDLHPDDPNANARMQEINEAYDLLSDPGKARTWESQTRRPAHDGGMGANNRGRYGEANGWRVYTYYTGDDNGWNQPPRQETEFHPIVNPFRGIFRFIGGLILFRFIVTLLRWGLFGFFF
jgi:curved DNA-binding protein CbpA